MTEENGSERRIAAVRQVIEDAGTHQNDPAHFIPLHTAETSVVNFGGRRVQGRETLREAMTAALASPPADVLTRVEIEEIRFLRPDVALVACVKQVFDGRAAGQAGALPASSGRLMYVLTEEADGWRIASAQTTPILG
ncbi:SgcJ/EcaC family oxidoreductase [Kitasatospora sp. NBC_00070]|uniref:SgcJ/EcaC family oxidoreductase n=1 Tax=Kitasatospora sp. NBC_00070 TaxID=2975962 RepID=UPI003250F142